MKKTWMHSVLFMCISLIYSNPAYGSSNAGMGSILGPLLMGGLGAYMQHEKAEMEEEREEHKTDREQAMLRTKLQLEQERRDNEEKMNQMKFAIEAQKLQMAHSDRAADRRLKESDQQFNQHMKMMMMQRGMNPYMMSGMGRPGMAPSMGAPGMMPGMSGYPSMGGYSRMGGHPSMGGQSGMMYSRPHSTIGRVAHGAASVAKGILSGILSR